MLNRVTLRRSPVLVTAVIERRNAHALDLAKCNGGRCYRGAGSSAQVAGAPDVQEEKRRRLEALAKADRRVSITFAIVGVQKGATTTLYRMVTKHPWVAGGPQKEMRYFFEEWHDWDQPDYNQYARPASGQERIAGDATPEYLFWP